MPSKRVCGGPKTNANIRRTSIEPPPNRSFIPIDFQVNHLIRSNSNHKEISCPNSYPSEQHRSVYIYRLDFSWMVISRLLFDLPVDFVFPDFLDVLVMRSFSSSTLPTRLRHCGSRHQHAEPNREPLIAFHSICQAEALRPPESRHLSTASPNFDSSRSSAVNG